jgi:hypothetical protein
MHESPLSLKLLEGFLASKSGASDRIRTYDPRFTNVSGLVLSASVMCFFIR